MPEEKILPVDLSFLWFGLECTTCFKAEKEEGEEEDKEKEVEEEEWKLKSQHLPQGFTFCINYM